MRNEEIRLTGINRASAEQDSAAGACEELINMRLESGALRPTGEKELVMEPASGEPDMLRIYIHRIANQYNYIGVYADNSHSYVVWLNENDGEYSVTRSPLVTTDDGTASIDVKFIGNLMVVASSPDDKIRTFSFMDGQYTALPDVLPDVTLTFLKADVAAKTEIGEGSDYVSVAVKDKYDAAGNITSEMIYQDIIGGVSYLRGGKNKNESEGMVGVCANFTLYDGTETKPTTPVWFCLGGRPLIAFGALLGNTGQNDLHINMRRSTLKTGLGTLKVGSTSWNSSLYNQYKDYIKSINIYSTKPVSVTDYWKTFTETHAATVLEDITDWAQRPASTTIGYSEYTGRTRRHTTVTYRDFSFDVTDPAEYGKQLFYKQKEIRLMENLTDMDDMVQLDFSDAILTNDTMRVENSGYIDRFGEMEVYNKRLHLYNTKNTLSIPSPLSSWLLTPDWSSDPSSPLTADELSAINCRVVGDGNVEGIKVVITTRTDTKNVKTLFSGGGFAAVTKEKTTAATLYKYTNGGTNYYSKKLPSSIQVGDVVYDTSAITPLSTSFPIISKGSGGQTIYIELGPFGYQGTVTGTYTTEETLYAYTDSLGATTRYSTIGPGNLVVGDLVYVDSAITPTTTSERVTRVDHEGDDEFYFDNEGPFTYSGIIQGTVATNITLYSFTDGTSHWYSEQAPAYLQAESPVYNTTALTESTASSQISRIDNEGTPQIYVESAPFTYSEPVNGTVTTDDGLLLLARSASPVIDARDYIADVYVKYNYGGTKYAKFQLSLEESKAYDTSYAYAGTTGFKRLKDLHYRSISTAWSDAADERNAFFEMGYIELTNNSSAAEYDGITSSPEDHVYYETDVVTVSKENNPTFFPPQQSYRIGGNIIGIAVNSQGVSDVQIGQWPMDVFTDNGVYALEQGTGEVVYGSVVKIADDIAAAGGMVPTPYGIAFLQGDGVYILNGRRAQRISVGLDGFVDLDIRKCPQFINAHGESIDYTLYAYGYQSGPQIAEFVYTDTPTTGQGTYTLYDETHNELPYGGDSIQDEIVVTIEGQTTIFSRSTGEDIVRREVKIYNIFPYLLGEREPIQGEETYVPLSFREQMAAPENILIGYDNIREELWISDVREEFSYVYSFAERSWHTVTRKFGWYNVNYAVIDGEMYDITKENHSDNTIRHIQSRPLKLGSETFKTIERMIARINVNGPLESNPPYGQSTPKSDKLFSMYVYGSRDLRNWYMIGASQWDNYSSLLQIGKTSSKFKAFIVSLGGKLTRGSEISAIQATIGDFYTSKLR